MPNHITGVIDREEGDFIILKISGDQELYWPKKNIDFNYAEGDAVNVYLSKDEIVTVDNEDRSKNLLRQIFQPNV
ncbi:MAG: hypothetical protein WCT26_02340 [Candidatus Buchananbacteria bacterium]|jgi:hypothetical protein